MSSQPRVPGEPIDRAEEAQAAENTRTAALPDAPNTGRSAAPDVPVRDNDLIQHLQEKLAAEGAAIIERLEELRESQQNRNQRIANGNVEIAVAKEQLEGLTTQNRELEAMRVTLQKIQSLLFDPTQRNTVNGLTEGILSAQREQLQTLDRNIRGLEEELASATETYQAAVTNGEFPSNAPVTSAKTRLNAAKDLRLLTTSFIEGLETISRQSKNDDASLRSLIKDCQQRLGENKSRETGIRGELSQAEVLLKPDTDEQPKVATEIQTLEAALADIERHAELLTQTKQTLQARTDAIVGLDNLCNDLDSTSKRLLGIEGNMTTMLDSLIQRIQRTRDQIMTTLHTVNGAASNAIDTITLRDMSEINALAEAMFAGLRTFGNTAPMSQTRQAAEKNVRKSMEQLKTALARTPLIGEQVDTISRDAAVKIDGATKAAEQIRPSEALVKTTRGLMEEAERKDALIEEKDAAIAQLTAEVARLRAAQEAPAAQPTAAATPAVERTTTGMPSRETIFRTRSGREAFGLPPADGDEAESVAEGGRGFSAELTAMEQEVGLAPTLAAAATSAAPDEYKDLFAQSSGVPSPEPAADIGSRNFGHGIGEQLGIEGSSLTVETGLPQAEVVAGTDAAPEGTAAAPAAAPRTDSMELPIDLGDLDATQLRAPAQPVAATAAATDQKADEDDGIDII